MKAGNVIIICLSIRVERVPLISIESKIGNEKIIGNLFIGVFGTILKRKLTLPYAEMLRHFVKLSFSSAGHNSSAKSSNKQY